MEPKGAGIREKGATCNHRENGRWFKAGLRCGGGINFGGAGPSEEAYEESTDIDLEGMPGLESEWSNPSFDSISGEVNPVTG